MSSLTPHAPDCRRLLVVAVLCLVTAGCATSAAVRRGRSAEQRQDYDRAVVEYSKAVHLNPDHTDARLGLERAKLRGAEYHFLRARRLSATGKLDAALVEYELASELNPTSGDIDDELRATRNALRAKGAATQVGKTDLQSLIERTRDLPPPGLDLPADAKK